MITCFGCHGQVSGSQARIVRICHRVVYLCPECHPIMVSAAPFGSLNRGLTPTRENSSHLRTNQWSSVLQVLLQRG